MVLAKKAAVALALALVAACVAVDAKCAPEGKMHKVGPALALPVREGAWSRMLSSARMTRPILRHRMRNFLPTVAACAGCRQ
jgi:hypothetical protein